MKSFPGPGGHPAALCTPGPPSQQALPTQLAPGTDQRPWSPGKDLRLTVVSPRLSPARGWSPLPPRPGPGHFLCLKLSGRASPCLWPSRFLVYGLGPGRNRSYGEWFPWLPGCPLRPGHLPLMSLQEPRHTRHLKARVWHEPVSAVPCPLCRCPGLQPKPQPLVSVGRQGNSFGSLVTSRYPPAVWPAVS